MTVEKKITYKLKYVQALRIVYANTLWSLATAMVSIISIIAILWTYGTIELGWLIFGINVLLIVVSGWTFVKAGAKMEEENVT